MIARALAIAFVAATIVIASDSAHAGVKEKKMRAELLELKARVAQLEGQAGFLMRKGGERVIAPGIGGLCTDPCAIDSDQDGVGDCEDPCPCDASQADGDGDGTPDCADPCPDDATNACIDPCRQDADGDGLNDCEDPCPFDAAAATDADGDHMMDCNDPCPNDRKNLCLTPCPLDADGDGANDCADPCPWGERGIPGRPCIMPPMMPGGGMGMATPDARR